MPEVTTRKRVQKINEAKEIVAALEAKMEMQLSDPRWTLREAGDCVGNDRIYYERIEGAMGRTAGLAIEYGYDEIAADASQLVTDVQENDLNSD